MLMGIKVRGGVGLPQKVLNKLQLLPVVFLRNMEMQTGGIISITTRGPSKIYTGGVEFVSSELFDDYGYNLASFDLSGPIFTKRFCRFKNPDNL